MEARIKEFRRRTEAAGLGGPGVRYSSAFRGEAVTIARSLSGEPLSRVAERLGVHRLSLQRWMAREASSAFQPVEVVAGDKAPSGGITIVTPRGFRVEGLEVGEVARLLQELV